LSFFDATRQSVRPVLGGGAGKYSDYALSLTLFWAGKHWAYLAVVLDLFARKPVREQCHSHLTANSPSKHWKWPERRVSTTGNLLPPPTA